MAGAKVVINVVIEISGRDFIPPADFFLNHEEAIDVELPYVRGNILTPPEHSMGFVTSILCYGIGPYVGVQTIS